MSNIKIAVDNEECTPHKTHKWDAGWDLKSNNQDFTIKPGAKIKVHTVVKIAIPPRNMGLIFPRSGLGSKFRVGLANTIGVIDSDYRGELMVNLVNDGKEAVEIKQFDRFCQLVIVPINLDNLRVVDTLDDTARGEGGFGSTGVKNELPNFPEGTFENLIEAEAEELEEILEWTEENPDDNSSSS